MNKDLSEKFRIVLCDDDAKVRFYAEKRFQKFKNSFSENIDFLAIDFPEMEKMIMDANAHIDMLILDYRGKDDNETKGKTQNTAGMEILNLIAVLEPPIPTILYSAYIESDMKSADFEILKNTYPFIDQRIHKSSIANDAFEKIEEIVKIKLRSAGHIESNFKINQETHHLKKNIADIKEERLSEIISQLPFRSDKQAAIISEFGHGGLSGAKILELTQKDTETGITHIVLKLAVNPEKEETKRLKDEHQRAERFYQSFPRLLSNHIDHNWFESSDKQVAGFIMAKVENAKTLFDFLIYNEYDSREIETLLNKLFLGENYLASHYAQRVDPNYCHNWSAIFSNFAEKFLQIKDATEELKPLISTTSIPNDFIIHFENLILNQQWPNSLPKDFTWHTSKYTLCHGDFHAKNILIQGKELTPVLIDTGSLGPDHWATDLSRLIVYLFSRGLDVETKYYYDIYEIDEISKIAGNIIRGEKIRLEELNWDDTRKKKNAAIVFALDWLVENRVQIYETFYNEYEFQLALMKWFLREFYRQSTPPNRRVTALCAAYDCFIEAQKSVTNMRT